MDSMEREIRERRDIAFRFALSASNQNQYWMRQLMEREQELHDHLTKKATAFKPCPHVGHDGTKTCTEACDT